MDINRLNTLRCHYGALPLSNLWGMLRNRGQTLGRATAALNALDKAAGISTEGHQVGKRISLHEEELHWKVRPRFYHWLGHDACCKCGCEEHRRT